MRFYLVFIFLLAVSCGGKENGTDPVPTSPDNLASPELVEFNSAAAKAHRTAQELAELILGPGGIADRTNAIRTLPITNATEIGAWLGERDALRAQLDVVNQKSASFALEVSELEQNRRQFLAQQALNFPIPDETVTPQGLTTVQQPLVLEALAIATLSIGAYRFLKGFGEIADNTQRMVYTTAEGGPESRAAVIQILKENGVQISDSASAEEVIRVFKEQPRNLRRTMTTQVEAWNEDQYNRETPLAEDSMGRFQEAREDVPEIVNEGGEFALSQTVSMVQNVTGGVGNIVGGVPGAVVDLTLTATENTPTDIVQRRVTVYVTAGEKENLPTETSPTPPTTAREVIEKAASGDQSVNPDQVIDAAIALVQQVADGLRATFGPAVQIAQKFALTGGTLSEEPQEDGSVKQDLVLPLPHFSEGEVAEVVIAREGFLPQEVVNHSLRADNPIVLDNPPLLGTITVESAAGEAGSASQFFDVTGHVIRVPRATQLICQGTNAVCSPTTLPILGDSSVTFSVEVFGTAQLRLTRRDTGESYTLILKSSAAEPEPEPTNNTPSNLDANLFGTWTFVDSEGDEYFWRFNADGTCVQGLPGSSTNWKWAIENGQLKLFVDGGTPAYKQYKIEGNQLFFWVDVIEDWSLPFTKG